MFHSALLINHNTLVALQRSFALAPSVSERLAFEAAHAASNRGVPKIAGRQGKTAVIAIDGVLTPSPDLFSKLFGGGNTAYSDIKAALLDAEQDRSVDRILLQIDSPGGTVAGLFETLDVLSSTTKPISVQASCACSAAYAIAASAGRIEATSVAAQFGSIGVAASIFVSDDLVHVANTASPAKRPDVKSDAGKAMVRQELDALYGVFVEAIARGRGTSPAAVGKDYGKGATVIARDALSRGMIDRIAPPRSAMPGSDMAAAERMIERVAAVQRGEFRPHAGESQHEFAKRMSAEVLGYETAPARRTQPASAFIGRSYTGHEDATEQGIDLFLQGAAADAYVGDDGRDIGDAVCDQLLGKGWESR